MNIILKKSTSGGSVTVRTGITGRRWRNVRYGINNGTAVEEKGFLNYTIGFVKGSLS
jgi:iron complex outermembrane receptor protein